MVDIDIINQTKELLSEERHRIKLRDHVIQHVRKAIESMASETFPVDSAWSAEEFEKRLTSYNSITTDICNIQALLAFYGRSSQDEILTLAPKRIIGQYKSESGKTGWLAVRWYPAFLLLYFGGIAAVAADNYRNLSRLLQAPVADPMSSESKVSLSFIVTQYFSEVFTGFKLIEGYDKKYTPHSEYLFILLQPIFDDLFFTGSEFESIFDRFEMLFALEHAEQYSRLDYGRVWGPVGRFGWKYSRGGRSNPLNNLITEAKDMGPKWPPLDAGLFQGDIGRFDEVSSEYSELIGRLGWF